MASAPGKVILFGEHAVVSGIPALGAAIDLRAKARIEDAPGRLEIEARDLMLTMKGFTLDALRGTILTKGVSEDAVQATKYVSAVLREFDSRNLKVTMESNIPPSSGLGSSASVVVATLAALNRHRELDLSLEEVAREAHRIEKDVQKGLGSPIDTALATFGGYQLVSGKAEPVDLPELDLVIGFTGVPHDTRSEVEKVQNFRAKHPQIVNLIFQAIGEISKDSLEFIREQRLADLGRLMDANHGLLESIGVGSRKLSELIYAARGAGEALGAKLTGAGGGGCMIALPADAEGAIKVMTAIVQAGGKPFHVTTGCEGVRLE
ncbi:MAG: mevalonate kinase [Methanotrichaceae archaeon]